MMIKEIVKAVRGRIFGNKKSNKPHLPTADIAAKMELHRIRILRADGTIEELEI